jgi:hypothetical protein
LYAATSLSKFDLPRLSRRLRGGQRRLALHAQQVGHSRHHSGALLGRTLLAVAPSEELQRHLREQGVRDKVLFCVLEPQLIQFGLALGEFRLE